MNITGIIAEYNPFHRGHQYHIEQSRKATNADYVIVVQSGNFVQRGSCAIADKYARARAALECGADLVIELPAIYALSSAEWFAKGSVCLLNSLGIVTHLSFGCENVRLETLTALAAVLCEEPPCYQKHLQQALSMGHAFPYAREYALEKTVPDLLCGFESEFPLQQPNTILGIEYCKALQQCNSTMIPTIIPRIGGAYHDEEPDAEFSSAASLRSQLSELSAKRTSSKPESILPDSIRQQLPPASCQALTDTLGKSFPMFEQDLSSMLRYALLQVPQHDYTPYLDVTEAISNRICANLFAYESFSQFAMLLKTKEVTYTRICRCLLHILLNIRWEDIHMAASLDHRTYVHILGMRAGAANLLHEIHAHSTLPIITNPAKCKGQLSPKVQRMLDLDIFAAQVYHAAAGEKFHHATECEFKRQFLKL